jgi:hypothetical protein
MLHSSHVGDPCPMVLNGCSDLPRHIHLSTHGLTMRPLEKATKASARAESGEMSPVADTCGVSGRMARNNRGLRHDRTPSVRPNALRGERCATCGQTALLPRAARDARERSMSTSRCSAIVRVLWCSAFRGIRHWERCCALSAALGGLYRFRRSTVRCMFRVVTARKGVSCPARSCMTRSEPPTR